MKKILFVDLEFHRATGSSQFFVDLLRRRFTVDVRFVRSRFSRGMPTRREAAAYDAVVFWQVVPGSLQVRLLGRPCVCVPMFDGETGNLAKWRRHCLLGVRVISFCEAESVLLRRAGFDPLDVRYFPVPDVFRGGNPRRVFLWTRGGVDEAQVRMRFPAAAGYEVVVRREDAKEGSQARGQYWAAVGDCGVYVAPRFLEGIGLGFLEAMARGMCVVAHDAPTMNEVVKSGRNGILLDFRSPAQGAMGVSDSDVRRFQKSAYETACAGRRKWEGEFESAILGFVDKTIEEHREMRFGENLKWLAWLPLHFLWDLKTAYGKLVG